MLLPNCFDTSAIMPKCRTDTSAITLKCLAADVCVGAEVSDSRQEIAVTAEMN